MQFLCMIEISICCAEDAECVFTARRDNYVARTFSHMARARLDHAVSRSADLELLESEKWEMRWGDHPFCPILNNVISRPYTQPLSVYLLYKADTGWGVQQLARPVLLLLYGQSFICAHLRPKKLHSHQDACIRAYARCSCRFADDGPCTLSQSGASEEGAISKAKRMMSEAATAQASIFMRGEGTDQRCSLAHKTQLGS